MPDDIGTIERYIKEKPQRRSGAVDRSRAYSARCQMQHATQATVTKLAEDRAEQLKRAGQGQRCELAAKILESRGSAPRLFRNTLVFLAADKVRYQDLDEALRKYLAWDSIVEEKETPPAGAPE